METPETVPQTVMIIKPRWDEYPGLLITIAGFISKNNLAVSLHHAATAKREFWEEFYSSHNQSSYFEEMVTYLTSSDSIFFVFEGGGAVQLVREWVVKIRARYGKSSRDTQNIAHASDSEAGAEREVKIVKEFRDKGRL
jgi:nucleoside-diphosphate kinase